ncbi:hypothetical protein [Puerhibacterium sp. TATVAM-FAB25]|uniref:hypothetical protein n=1 Tax=Puerhibacterium sp. TATVAM-FAB25 TaxID=3093699 RepID=UPI00397C25C4
MTRAFAVGIGSMLLTFLAALLPALAGRADALVLLVQAGAVTSVLVHPATLGAAVRAPAAPAARRGPLRAGAVALAAVVVLGALAALGLRAGLGAAAADVAGLGPRGEAWLGPDVAVPAAVTVVLLAGNGAYVLQQARLTAVGSYPALMSLRLTYALAVVAGTGACLLAHAPAPAFVVAAAGAYGIAVLAAAAWRRGAAGAGPSAVAPWRAELRAGVVVGGALALTAAAGAVGALATGHLGAGAAAWAVLTRVANGFETLGGHVVAPAGEVRLTGALARDDRSAVRDAVRGAVRRSLLLALGFGVAGLVVLRLTPVGDPPAVVLAGALLFYGAQVVHAPVARLWGLVGARRARLAWDAARTGALVAALLGAGGTSAAAPALAVVGVAGVAVYVGVVLRAAGPAPVASPAPARRTGLAEAAGRQR